MGTPFLLKVSVECAWANDTARPKLAGEIHTAGLNDPGGTFEFSVISAPYQKSAQYARFLSGILRESFRPVLARQRHHSGLSDLQ